MKQFSKLTLLALGFGILAVALSSIPNQPAIAGPGAAPVTIQGPLPLLVSGTVGVNNFPSTQPVSGTVNAARSGTWSVGINGTPTVNLGTGNNVGISGSVTVGNTATRETGQTGITAPLEAANCGATPPTITVLGQTIDVSTAAFAGVDDRGSCLPIPFCPPGCRLDHACPPRCHCPGTP